MHVGVWVPQHYGGSQIKVRSRTKGSLVPRPSPESCVLTVRTRMYVKNDDVITLS